MGLQQKVSQYSKLEAWRVAFLCEKSAFYNNFGKGGALCIREPSNLKIRHIVQVGPADSGRSNVKVSKLHPKALKCGGENSNYSAAKYRNSRIQTQG